MAFHWQPATEFLSILITANILKRDDSRAWFWLSTNAKIKLQKNEEFSKCLWFEGIITSEKSGNLSCVSILVRMKKWGIRKSEESEDFENVRKVRICLWDARKVRIWPTHKGPPYSWDLKLFNCIWYHKCCCFLVEGWFGWVTLLSH